MQKTIIFHKFWNLKNFLDHPGMIKNKRNFFNPELCWLEAVNDAVLKNDDLINLWTIKTPQIAKFGYSSLGQLIIKNTKIKILDAGESFMRLKIDFIFDSRELQYETRENINRFFKLLFDQLIENGVIKKDKQRLEDSF